MKLKEYKVCEIFPACQGEGKTVGTPVVFIRLFGCNLAATCGKNWCDSKYSVFGTEFTKMNVKQLGDKVEKICNDSGLVIDTAVITGGEPFLQDVEGIIKELESRFIIQKYEIETNGLLLDKAKQKFLFNDIIQLNISPKFFPNWEKFYLTNKMNATFNALTAYDRHRTVQFKFVLEGPGNFDKDILRTACKQNIEKFVDYHEIPERDVFIMTEGYTREKQISNMSRDIEWSLKKGYRYTPRMHVLAYDMKRKV